MDGLTGFPSTLTDQQMDVLDQLKDALLKTEYSESIATHPDVDEFLLRVLRSTMKDKKKTRIFDLEPAIERTLSILRFKEKYRIHEKPEKMDEYRKVYPKFVYKDKKINKMILITRMGEFASHGKFSHFTEEEWSRCVGYGLERFENTLRDFSKKQGVENRGYVTITDCKGLCWSVLSRKKATVFLANLSGQNYPELINKVYLVNTPWIFSKIFSLIKPLLDPVTVSKFEMHSSVPSFFKDIFDTSALPKEFGGESDVVVPYPLDSKKFDPSLLALDPDNDAKLQS